MPPLSPQGIASCAHSVTVAAKLFAQLAPPSRCPPKPVLEFLWPRAGITPRRTFRDSSSSARFTTRTRTASAASSAVATRRTSLRRPSGFGPTTIAATTPRAVFTPYTPARKYTQAVYNPQKDDDGNEMKLEITPRAAKVSPSFSGPPTPRVRLLATYHLQSAKDCP